MSCSGEVAVRFHQDIYLLDRVVRNVNALQILGFDPFLAVIMAEHIMRFRKLHQRIARLALDPEVFVVF